MLRKNNMEKDNKQIPNIICCLDVTLKNKLYWLMWHKIHYRCTTFKRKPKLFCAIFKKAFKYSFAHMASSRHQENDKNQESFRILTQ